MEFAEVLSFLRPQWAGGHWAKSSGALLWAHHFAVWNVGTKIARRVPSLDEHEFRLLELAFLTHDIGKLRPACQERLHAGTAPGDHKLQLEELHNYLSTTPASGPALDETDIRTVWEIAVTHHSVSDEDIATQLSGRIGLFVRLLRTADWIASMDSVDYETLARLQEFYRGRIAITYYEFSRFPSPTSYLFVRVALERYRQLGWEPLVVFPAAAVFAGDADLARPSRSEMAGDLERAVISESLALQRAVPLGYTGDFLTLLSKQYPDLFLEAQKPAIIEKLGSDTDRAVVFQKLTRDILSARNQIDQQARDSCPILALVESSNSTSAHPKAKEKYQEVYGVPPPDKVNRDMLDPLFSRSRFRDLIPPKVAIPVDPEKPMREATAEELFSVLTAIASPPSGQEPAASHLARYIENSLVMEEDIDFAAAAREIFDRYKAYKRTSDAEKGACERCACPVTAKMQPGLNFATAPQAFSQIKPKYQYRAVCPLCGFDNLVVRSGVRSGKSRIYARIETKVPDLLRNMAGLEALVNKVASGVRRPRRFVPLSQAPELAQLPFPSRLHIPLSDDDPDRTIPVSIPLNERGLLIPIGYTDTSRGPRDLRAEFEPLYHVLRFLGFQVSLGTEEQNGLFGLPVDSGPRSYLRSLAVVLLANIVDKKSNHYIFAAQLIDHSPSVALAHAAGDGRDKFGLRGDLMSNFLDYLIQADVPVTSQKGGIGMASLLADAALLAPSLVDAEQAPDVEEPEGLEDEPEEAVPQKKKRWGGIWSFCEHKPGEKLTKHSATKPISQALDELMLGRGTDIAMNKFLQHISVRIPAARAADLEAFVAGVRDIIVKAEGIRVSNITDFLRYKNGLLSAVFMFTRYPNLKTVLAKKED